MWCLDAQLSESSPWHGHDVYEFVAVLMAGGALSTRDGNWPLRTGDTLLVPPGREHRFSVVAGETIRVRLVCFTLSDANAFLSPQLIGRLPATGGRLTQAGHADPAALLTLAASLREGLDDVAALGDWATLGLLLARHVERSALVPAGAYDGRLAALVAWLDEHLDEAVTLEAAASRFGMSRSLLSREFRRHTGLSFVGHCNRRRLERAAGLMASGDASVAEAAFAAGFANLSHFHRQFKSVYGLTPAAFRRKIRDDGGLGAPAPAIVALR
ncbi:AraC family transcriptional regulator [Pleomorphomonas koreensis]|uniref:AraC family transcriptional regulator n=1 Tax=Pleomorphomonas koreensis TaxID=257440 RepID=UPI0004247BC1|nr:AraC family transcriptional regulator [Pleomorphomonas koreensis]